MGRKNTINAYVTPTQTFPLNTPTSISPSISLATAFTTMATETSNLDNIAYQIVITTTNSTGVFTLQCSSDYRAQVPGDGGNPGNWTTVGTGAVTAGANDTAVIWVNLEFCSPYVRLAYTPTIAGTGTCNIILTAKVRGA